MNYGNMIRQTWSVTWDYKFMILLGLILAFGINSLPSIATFAVAPIDPKPYLEANQAFSAMPKEQQLAFQMAFQNYYVSLIYSVLIGIPLWAAARVALGGVIVSTDNIASNLPASFASAMSAGWKRGWQLVGVGLLGAIPSQIVILVMILYMKINMGSLMPPFAVTDPKEMSVYIQSFFRVFAISMGIYVGSLIILIPLMVWSLMAERACSLENTSVLESYRRGWQILRNHFKNALMLTLVQLGLGLAISLAVIVIWMAFGLLMTALPCLFLLLCILIPVLVAGQGILFSGFHVMWTLAWREWTDEDNAKPAAPEGQLAT